MSRHAHGNELEIVINEADFVPGEILVLMAYLEMANRPITARGEFSEKAAELLSQRKARTNTYRDEGN